MLTPQLRLTGLDNKLIVDLFAGGGGFSVAMEMAWGRSPDIAINHNEDALSLHQANHPQTEHYVADVYEVCPKKATQGRPVGWLHLSPDCTHFSQAKGGQPRSSKIRALAWVGIRWAGQARPDWISLENVKQFTKWGPLIAKRCSKTGRVVTLEMIKDPVTGRMINRVAEPGERVPVQEQFLVPDPKREGQTYRRWRSMLIELGYSLDCSNIIAADQGGHTTRERHFEIGNRIGRPTQWNKPTHFKNPKRGQKKWKPAADCIDWSIPCPSIFERKKPLVNATLSRIARGIFRYVLGSGDPFIVQAGHGEGKPGARRWSYGCNDIQEPLGTVTASNGGFYLAAPTLVQTGYGEREGQAPRSLDLQKPLGTVVGSQKHALAVAYMMQANGGFNTTPGHDMREPMSTVTNTGSQQQLVTAHMIHFRGNCDARDVNEPLRTISAAGLHHGLVTCTLSQEQTEGAERVAAFLMRYYGEGGQWSDLRDPLTTITTKDRMALVTVTIRGASYVIVDIGLRMLTPRELFRAQDFPDSYIIDHGHDGRKFSKTVQVRMVGNSVNPLMAAGFLALNAPYMAIQRKAA